MSSLQQFVTKPRVEEDISNQLLKQKVSLRSHDLHLTPDLPSELPKEFLRIGESAPASIWGFSFILGLGLPRTYKCGTKKIGQSFLHSN